MDDLLHLTTSDGADALSLVVGAPPVIVLGGESHAVEGPPLSTQDAEHLLQSIATTRQRRELRQHGEIQFIYRFRRITDFVIHARVENENIAINIH